MSAIVTVQGQVRSVRRLKSATSAAAKEAGQPVEFGTEYAILTDAQNILGETLGVLVFDPRLNDEPVPTPAPGDAVHWVVEVEANRYGLSAQFKHDVNAAPVGGFLDAAASGI